MIAAAAGSVGGHVQGPERPEPYRRGVPAPLDYTGPGREDDAPDVTEVVIGWFGPGDPGHVEFGTMWRGALLAIEEANTTGGYRPRAAPVGNAAVPFRLVPAWSESPWKAGVSDLLKVVYEQRAWAVVGGVDGTSTHLAVQVALKSRFLLLSPGSSDPTADRGNVPWLFSLPAPDTAVARAMVAVLTRQPVARLAILASTDHSSRATTGALRHELERHHLSPTTAVEVDASAGLDAAATVEQALARPSDAIAVVAPVGTTADLVSRLRRAGYAGAIVTGPSGARTSFHERFTDPLRQQRLHLLRPDATSGPQILRAAEPASRVVELGVPVHYVDYGGEGPAMVLIHGLGGAHVNWMSVGQGLAERARVVAIDLPGFGRTPTEGDSASIHANRALVSRFVDRVMGEPSILVGNSMGGLISLMTAAETPATVSGLVLVNPALPAAPGGFFDLAVAAAFAGYCVPGIGELLMSGRKLLLGSEGSVRQMLDFCCVDASRVDPDVVAATIALSQERTKTAGGNAAFLSAARSIVASILRRGAFERMIDRITAPALLVHGTHDRLVPVAAAKALAARRSDWTLEIFENIGHVPQLEDPAGFIAAVDRWLRRIGAALFAAGPDDARTAS